MIASTSFLPSSVTMSGRAVAVTTRASLWMVAVPAQPSWRQARRTFPLSWARSRARAPRSAAAPAAPAARNSRRPSVIVRALLRLDLRHAAERFGDLLRGVLIILEL